MTTPAARKFIRRSAAGTEPCSPHTPAHFPLPATPQNGTGGGYNAIEDVAALDDNSVILAGFSEENWDGEHIGRLDFAVVKLNPLGVEEWRWQVNVSRCLLFMVGGNQNS